MVILQLNYTMKAPTGQPFSGRPVGFSLLSGVALVRQPPKLSFLTFSPTIDKEPKKRFQFPIWVRKSYNKRSSFTMFNEISFNSLYG